MLTTEQQKMAEELGTLLAEAPLPEDIRLRILYGIEMIPDEKIAELIQALRSGSDQIAQLTEDLQAFLGQQKQDWQNVQTAQQDAATKLEEDITAELSRDLVDTA